MRLDKFVSKANNCTRTEARKRIHNGKIRVNGFIEKSISFSISPEDSIAYKNRNIEIPGPCYILLNKPKGYICSSTDEVYPSALRLLSNNLNIPNSLAFVPENLHFAGRLDVDTTGLVLISSDGQWTHRVTSPRNKNAKKYRVGLVEPLTDAQTKALENGILLRDSEKPTQKSVVSILSKCQIELTLFEGRYHQVKRMMAAIGNHVESLHRCSVGKLNLNEELKEGEWRELDLDEIALF